MASDLETSPNELKKYDKNKFQNLKLLFQQIGGWVKKDLRVTNNQNSCKFSKIVKVLYNYKILDFTFAYRIIQKALKGYKIAELRHGFALEILLMPLKGFNIITVPAKWKKDLRVGPHAFNSYISYLKVLWRNI